MTAGKNFQLKKKSGINFFQVYEQQCLSLPYAMKGYHQNACYVMYQLHEGPIINGQFNFQSIFALICIGNIKKEMLFMPWTLQ